MIAKPNIILASTSPRRKELLSLLGFPFEVVPSSYEEDMTRTEPPRELVQLLAKGKADAVVTTLEKPAIVIAADTFIVHDNRCIGKPTDAMHAALILRELSGTVHQVMTGISCVNMYTEEHIEEAHVGDISLKEMTDEEIARYIATHEPLDKAGAYAVQGRGATIVKEMKGDFYTIMGLPVYRIADILESWGLPRFS